MKPEHEAEKRDYRTAGTLMICTAMQESRRMQRCSLLLAVPNYVHTPTENRRGIAPRTDRQTPYARWERPTAMYP